MPAHLPTGTVTFLFTDVEGSTVLLRELGPDRYAQALGEHRRAVRETVDRHGGVEVDTQGDSFFVAFPSAPDALAAAVEMTDELGASRMRVRIGVHTGTALVTDEGYVGSDIHVAARIAAVGHGGQILVSAATAALAPRDDLRDLGEHRLKDIDGPVSIFQLDGGAFPPLRTISNTNLPHPASSFVGRAQELEDVRASIEGGARLLTLTGPGGSGKTRLAVEAAGALVPSFKAGVLWVDLAAVRDPALVSGTIALALGARGDLAQHIGERELLVLLDNFEQVIAAAPEVSALLSACPNLTMMVTSRELLRVRGEVELAVPPLAEPEAVALFCDRAKVEPSLEIVELCEQLDSLPLAVELAAARTKALSPAQILDRLSKRLDLLAGGRDADPRQRTLRATIEWSYDLLPAEEQQLFRRLAVFAGGCTLEAAEAVAGASVDTMQSLVEKSLVLFSDQRYRMLETIREFAGERLESAEGAAVRERLRAFVLALAEASAPSLHTAAETAVSSRLAPDYANVRAAVRYALEAGALDEVGRMLGGLYPFLISHGQPAEALRWAEAALAARDRLTEHDLAEALVAGGELARFAGDLDRATELKEELATVQVDLRRPNWRAATLADLCEIALARRDYDAARRYAERSAEAGGGPRATLCFAELALQVDDLNSAESKGLEALAGYEEGAFNHACALEILAETARRRGDCTLATERFSAGLRSFAALNDGGGLADCLEGLARLAADARDGDRAGRLLGAAERLRETRGRQPTRTDVPAPDVPAPAREEGRGLTFDEAVAYGLRSEEAGAERSPDRTI